MTRRTTALATIGLAVACGATPMCASAQETPKPPYFGRAPDRAVPPEQARLLAEINPTHINRYYPSGSVVSITAGEVERIDLTDVLLPSRTQEGYVEIDEGRLVLELEAALDRLRPLTLRDRRIELAIRTASVGGTDLYVRGSELIDGIPVEPEGLIIVDVATGRIRSFSMAFIADGTKPPDRSSWLSERDAVALAQRAVASEHGGAFPPATEARLRLVQSSELEVHPEWTVQFSTVSYAAIVDAVTGDTRTHSTIIH